MTATYDPASGELRLSNGRIVAYLARRDKHEYLGALFSVSQDMYNVLMKLATMDRDGEPCWCNGLLEHSADCMKAKEVFRVLVEKESNYE